MSMSNKSSLHWQSCATSHKNTGKEKKNVPKDCYVHTLFTLIVFYQEICFANFIYIDMIM